MVWPLLPLVAEGLLRPSLVASAGAAAIACAVGVPPLAWPVAWPLCAAVSLVGLGLACRARRAALGPLTLPGGSCGREEHAERVRRAREAAEQPGPLRMFKATTSNTFRPQQIAAREESRSRLDLSGFVHVLEVNDEELWCDIEACATFETFVCETLPRGVAPLVIPELRTITVGGAVVGIGVESSSFRHGFFHEGLVEADLLLASGEVVTVRPDGEHAELFRAIPNSLGSFGYLLRLRMRVQRCRPLVRLEKVWFSSPEALVEGLSSACGREDVDFVDGVALGDEGGVVMTARFVAEAPKGAKLQHYGFLVPFYPSVLREGVEYLTSQDYLWRWDADWFWCSQIFPGLKHAAVRWLCGSEVLRSDVYKAFNDAVIKNVLEPLGRNRDEELLIQDIEIPAERSAEWLRKFMQVVPTLRIGKMRLGLPGRRPTAPIWLCPVRGTASPLMPMRAGELYVNFGFWDALEGPGSEGGMREGRINRAVEALTEAMEGKKTLYSNVYFSEEAFYRQYNGDLYKAVKARYDPNGRLRGWYERLMHA